MSRTDSDELVAGAHVHAWDRGLDSIMCECLQIIPIETFRQRMGR